MGRNTTASARFRLDGGAPWLNLAATIGRAYSAAPQERLATPTDLDAWLTAVGLNAPSSTEADLDLAHALRADCRELSEALITHQPPRRELLEHLTTAAADISCTATLDGALKWATAPAALGAVAASALSYINGPEKNMLTQCQDPECAWVFLDPSHRRHWCSATTCGTRTRVQAHRARTRETP